MIPVSYNVRSLTVRRATTLATGLGIALVVFVLDESQMLARGIERTRGLSGSVDKVIVMRKGADAEMSSAIETRFVNLVLAGPGIKRGGDGQPLGVGEVQLVVALERADAPDDREAAQVSNVQLRGVPDNVMAVRPQVRITQGRPAKPGTDEVIIGRRIAGEFKGLALGQSFELKKNRRGQVVGIFEAGGSSFESEVWADIETVRSSFGREGIVSSITAQLEGATRFDAFKGAIESDKQLNVQVLRERDYFEKQSENTADLVRYLGIGIVFFFSIGAMIGAMITMYGAVSARQREIGTLRALGFSRTTILSSFLLEAILLATLGGAIGALASIGMGLVEVSMMNMQTWSEIVFSFEPSPPILIGAVVTGGVMGLVGGFLPALRAARTSPVDAMRA